MVRHRQRNARCVAVVAMRRVLPFFTVVAVRCFLLLVAVLAMRLRVFLLAGVTVCRFGLPTVLMAM
jgi:hypothetical protein